jgi:hypothetical protein
MDQSLRYQQNLRGHQIRVVVVRAFSNRLTVLAPRAVAVLDALGEMVPGELRLVSA